MPVQLLIALLVIVVVGLCAQYWRIMFAIAAALIIVAGLIQLNVIIDLRILHHLIALFRLGAGLTHSPVSTARHGGSRVGQPGFRVVL
jgi:hypothetical protein